MSEPSAVRSLTEYWPLMVYFGLAVANVVGMVLLSYVLGERHMERTTGEPFEAGIAPTGKADMMFDIRFYMIAMFFVIFDLEAVFLYSWAVAFREAGWPGYVEAVIFIAVLSLALVYLWRMGALDWSGTLRRRGGGASDAR